MARMTEVAARSPHAWFPVARSAEEISTATPDNRMVAYPYTKLMTSIMDVDMAAALLLASAEKADALGVPEEQRVYLRGWGYAEDPVHVAGHPELWRSPALDRRLVDRAGRLPASASTTWPTSISTRASPARSASPSTDSGWPRTTSAA